MQQLVYNFNRKSMYGSPQRTIERIKQLSEKHKVTAYQIGQGTNLSITGIQKILDGDTKNPRRSTLDSVLNFLEELDTQSEKGRLVAKARFSVNEDEPSKEKTSSKIEDIIADKVVKKLEPYFKNLETAMASNTLDLDDLLDRIEEIKGSKSDKL